jgi:hypothetical protein
MNFTPAAQAEIESIASEYNVSAPALAKVIFNDVKSYFRDTHIAQTKWFKAQPEHCVHVARIKVDGQAALNLHMVVDKKGTIYGTSEKVLSDEYHAEKIIEETRVDLKLGVLK